MRTVIEPFRAWIGARCLGRKGQTLVEYALILASLARRGARKNGQTLVEYSLILAIISIVMIAVMSLLGARIVVIFSAITNLLDTAQSSH